MYPSTIVLKNAAAANVTFVRLNADNSKVDYADQAASLSLPNRLTIGHQMTTAQNGSDRHMIKIAKTVLDSESRPCTVVLNCTISVPRLGITRTNVDDAIANLKEFLATANVDALLRGEL